ncbi:MAG: hypothetical protein JW881_10250 [Spirochaetales bacterium]|nr:hypothetical protein [Spirochaetales bacterium]
MRYNRIFIYIIAASTVFTALFSCDDIILRAFHLDPQSVSPPVGDFTATAGDGSVSLTWINPDNEFFNNVVLLRKTGGYPVSYDDPEASVIYDGGGESYTDNGVSNGATYYYCIYAVNKRGFYSEKPSRVVKYVSSFTDEIRKRCFYLIGGSSSYGNPFGNLIAEIDAFDPETGTVYPNVATLPHSRYSCAVASVRGKIYVFGGLDENQNTIETVDVLDVTGSAWPTNVWSTAKQMPLPRYSLRAENVENKIYVFGGSTNISIPFAAMSDYNHRYDPDSNNWTTDESKVPRLVNKFMNFSSSSYGGTVIYGVGRYNGSTTLTRTMKIHNMTGNFYESNDIDNYGTMPVNLAAAASVLYHKLLTDYSELFVYFNIGGCYDNGTYYEPLRQTSGAELRAIADCYYVEMPNSTRTVVDTSQPMKSSRAYAEAEYYGDYIYVFCGLTNLSSTVLSTYERLEVDDALTFPDEWEEFTNTGLNARYAFDITRVSN